MQSSTKTQENDDRSDSLLDAKLFSIIRNFSQFAKAINEEQNDLNNTMNNTINTVNTLIDQLNENKSALMRAEDEIQNLKDEIENLKQENENSSSGIQTRSLQLASHYDPPQNTLNSTINNDIISIKDEIKKLKENQKVCDKISHDFNCIKYEVKKIKANSKLQAPIQNTITERSVNNEEITEQINDLKEQIEEIKKKKKKTMKKPKFGFGKKKEKRISLSDDERVESKYLGSSSDDETETTAREPDSAVIDKLNMQQNAIDALKCDMKNLKENCVSPDAVKKIKKQIKKLKKKTDILENKALSKSNDSDDEEAKSKKTNDQESPDESETSVSNVKTMRSDEPSESKTQETSD